MKARYTYIYIYAHKRALLFMPRISIYVRCAHLCGHPAGSRGPRGAPQSLFVILMSHYIFVWGVGGRSPKCETRCNARRVLLEFHPPPRARGSPTTRSRALCRAPLKRFPTIRKGVYPFSASFSLPLSLIFFLSSLLNKKGGFIFASR